jgi:hypothetical protein
MFVSYQIHCIWNVPVAGRMTFALTRQRFSPMLKFAVQPGQARHRMRKPPRLKEFTVD